MTVHSSAPDLLSSRQPVAVDLFCGAGGLSLGLEQAGFEVAAGVDVNPLHAATHATNFPRAKTVIADIRDRGQVERELSGSLPRGVDLLVAGSPCQGFSAGGRRRVDDPRNRLLLATADLLDLFQPTYLVVENVRGLLFKDMAPVLGEFLRRVRERGYATVAPIWELDAQDFGVPQRRRRIFIVAHLTNHPQPTQPKPLDTKPTVWEAIEDLDALDAHSDLTDADLFTGKINPVSRYARQLAAPAPAGRGSAAVTGLTGCRRSIHSAEMVMRFGAVSPGSREPISRFFRLAKGGVAPTLRAGTDSSGGSFTAPRPIHPERPRCITVREAARLHSFPDWFAFHPTVWHGFRQVGNAVPPLMAHAVASAVRAALEEEHAR